MGWIFHESGNFILYDRGDMTSVMVKGPSLFGVNFGSKMFLLRFLALSQTLLLTSKGVNLDLIWFFISCCANLCVASASFHELSRFLRHSSKTGRWAVSMMLGMACGSYVS